MKTKLALVFLAGLALAAVTALAGGEAEAPAENPAKQQLMQLMQQQRELRKSLYNVQKRLGLEEDQEIKQLHEAYKQAKKALDDRIMERTKLDPEGARIYEEIDALNTQISELRKQAREQRQHRDKRPDNQDPAE
jgi:hypothetical protein